MTTLGRQEVMSLNFSVSNGRHTGMSNERIFISYRRDDAGWAAHHLYQRLSDEFGKQRVFMDIDSIPFAANFREAISEQIRGSAVCLAMIGPRWLESVTQRMDDPRDFVRIELESAHELDIPVIPLLVDGAAPPANKALPPSLRQLNLHDINTLPMRSGIDLNSDIDRIIRGLHHFFDDQKKYASGKSARAVRGGRRSGNRALFAAMLVVAVTILGVAISIVNKDWKAVEQPSRWIQDGLALEGVSIVDEANYGPKMLIIPAGKFLMGAPPRQLGISPAARGDSAELRNWTD